MFKRSIFWMTVVLMAAATVVSQGTFKPRDADEAYAWQIYDQYKKSVAAEARADSQVRQARRDVLDASYSSIGAFGADPSDRARVTQLRQQVNAEMSRQAELLAKWESKFYWRYGDLRWSNEKIYDPKTKRQMDRIEFALIYFPFNYKPAVKPPAVVKPPAKVEPPAVPPQTSTPSTTPSAGHWQRGDAIITWDPPYTNEGGQAILGRQLVERGHNLHVIFWLQSRGGIVPGPELFASMG